MSGVSKVPGAMVHTRMPLGVRVARGRKRHAHDASLGGGVGDLADLSVEGGDGCRVHDHAALSVVERLAPRDGSGGEAQHVEGADQVHSDDELEGVEIVRAAVARERSHHRAHAGAAHCDAQGAEGAGAIDGRLDLVAAGDVGLEVAHGVAQRAGHRMPARLVAIEYGDPRAGSYQAPGRRFAEP